MTPDQADAAIKQLTRIADALEAEAAGKALFQQMLGVTSNVPKARSCEDYRESDAEGHFELYINGGWVDAEPHEDEEIRAEVRRRLDRMARR